MEKKRNGRIAIFTLTKDLFVLRNMISLLWRYKLLYFCLNYRNPFLLQYPIKSLFITVWRTEDNGYAPGNRYALSALFLSGGEEAYAAYFNWSYAKCDVLLSNTLRTAITDINDFKWIFLISPYHDSCTFLDCIQHWPQVPCRPLFACHFSLISSLAMTFPLAIWVVCSLVSSWVVDLRSFWKRLNFQFYSISWKGKR